MHSSFGGVIENVRQCTLTLAKLKDSTSLLPLSTFRCSYM